MLADFFEVEIFFSLLTSSLNGFPFPLKDLVFQYMYINGFLSSHRSFLKNVFQYFCIF